VLRNRRSDLSLIYSFVLPLRALTGALLVGVSVVLFSCSGDDGKKTELATAPAVSTPIAPGEIRLTPAARAKARLRIDSLEARIREAVKSPTKAPDIKLAMYTIQAYQYFAADFPEDSLAPVSLDRAGQLYGGVLNDFQRAVEYYEKAYQKYPNYKNRPQLLLQQGLACEAAKDTTSAAICYQRLISGYPDKPLAAQARDLLKILRLSDAGRQKMFGGAPPAGAAARK
jgi:tetratricopeptide (TPR) repeat protein